jgi:UDP-N-acetylglucosamine 2-epimerase
MKDIAILGAGGRAEISSAVARAISREFRERLTNLHNPCGDCNASERMLNVRRAVDISASIVTKSFYER